MITSKPWPGSTIRLSGIADYFESLAGTTGKTPRARPGDRQDRRRLGVRRRQTASSPVCAARGLAQPDADVADSSRCPPQRRHRLVSRLPVGDYLRSARTSSCRPDRRPEAFGPPAPRRQDLPAIPHRALPVSSELFDRITIADAAEQETLPRHARRGRATDHDDSLPHGPSRAQVHNCSSPRRSASRDRFDDLLHPVPPGQWPDRIEEKILADAIVDGSPRRARHRPDLRRLHAQTLTQID